MRKTGRRGGPRGRLAVGALAGVVLGAVLVTAGLVLAQSAGTGGERNLSLKPEYSRVVGLEGFVREARLGGEVRSVFRTRDGSWNAVLLPNQILAALEDRKGVLEGRMMVVATGVVTVYRERNYLLLTRARVLPAPVME